VALVTLCVALALQGLWLGAIRLMVLFVAMLVGAAIAIPLGGALAGPVRSLLGVPRLLSGLVGTVLVTILLAVAALIAARPVARRILSKGRVAGRLNRWLGLGAGALEGVILGLLICWGLAVLWPMARVALLQAEAQGKRHAVAEMVAGLARDADRSLFGRAAAAANPLRDAALARIVAEFGHVAADREALRAFAENPRIKALARQPEVKAAIERAKQDQELMKLIERRDARGLLDNETMLDLVTDAALRRVLLQNQDAILQALEQARLVALPDEPDESEGDTQR